MYNNSKKNSITYNVEYKFEKRKVNYIKVSMNISPPHSKGYIIKLVTTVILGLDFLNTRTKVLLWHSKDALSSSGSIWGLDKGQVIPENILLADCDKEIGHDRPKKSQPSWLIKTSWDDATPWTSHEGYVLLLPVRNSFK